MDEVEEIYKKWINWLSTVPPKDKNIEGAKRNFRVLFLNLHKNGVVFSDAEHYIKRAVRDHRPPFNVVKVCYNNSSSRYNLSIKEFEEKWVDKLEETARAAFVEYYLKSSDLEMPSADIVVSVTPRKKYGMMSEDEYKAYQAYAAQFETIDIDEVRGK